MIITDEILISCTSPEYTTDKHYTKYKKVSRYQFLENRDKCVFDLMLPPNVLKKNYHNFTQDLSKRNTNQEQFIGITF